MISLEDLFDVELLEQVKQDVLDECQTFGEVVGIEVPSPLFNLTTRSGVTADPKYQAVTSGQACLVSRADGKIFIKFNQVINAKKARYALSGRSYNGRTVVGSFYPEHLFD